METFNVKINDKYSLNGIHFPIKDPKAYLVISTGMTEHSGRYIPLATFLNAASYEVYVLDHFGQGLNVTRVEDLQKWPSNAWNMTLKALNDLVLSLKKKGLSTYIMGFSMGSFFMQGYLETYPNSADKVVIAGSNGPRRFSTSFGYHVAKLIATKKNWDEKSHLVQYLILGDYQRAVKNRTNDNQWLSYNEKNVQSFSSDPLCGSVNTNGFYQEFLYGMNELYKKKNEKRISASDKILILSGVDDPCGSFGKGPKKLYKMYKKLGVKDVNIKVFNHMRHEIFNEVNKEDSYSALLNFLDK